MPTEISKKLAIRGYRIKMKIQRAFSYTYVASDHYLLLFIFYIAPHDDGI